MVSAKFRPLYICGFSSNLTEYYEFEPVCERLVISRLSIGRNINKNVRYIFITPIILIAVKNAIELCLWKIKEITLIHFFIWQHE
jgi:hypothetical protein